MEMDLGTWEFTTSPKESTASAYPSPVRLKGLMCCELERWEGTEVGFKGSFS
jgi:hypothetical protein